MDLEGQIENTQDKNLKIFIFIREELVRGKVKLSRVHLAPTRQMFILFPLCVAYTLGAWGTVENKTGQVPAFVGLTFQTSKISNMA